MVEISEINDRESLEAWLKDKPRDWSVQIASRAALRVLPIWWEFSRTEQAAKIRREHKRDLVALSVMRVLIISSVVGKMPTEDIKKADAANAAADFHASATVDAVVAADAAAATAASAAAASAANADAPYAATFAVAAYIAAANDAADNAIAIANVVWNEVRTECVLLDAGQDLHNRKLWPNADNFTENLWRKLKPTIPVAQDNAEEGNRAPPKEDWSFWVDWYDKVLEGKPQNWDLLYEIATSDAIDWDAGHLVANRQINEIVRRHSKPAEEPDLAEEVQAEKAAQPKPSKKVIERTRKAMGENRQSLPPTIDGLQEFILLEMKRWQESNELNATMPDECRRQVKNYLIMYEALEQLRAQIPEEGMPTKEQAEEAIGLTKLYLGKFKALPRDKADEVVGAIWERGGNVVDAGLILGTTGLCVQMGLSAQVGVAVGSVTFARKHAGDIIKAAKEYFTKSEGGT